MMSLGKIYFLSIYSLFFEQPLYPQALGISFELKNKDKSPALEKESESEVAQLCPTLCDRMDCSPPGSSVHGSLQARVLEWGAIAFPRCSRIPLITCNMLYMKMCIFLGNSPYFPPDSQKIPDCPKH